ncbi:hypothetical protein M5U04_14865 [Xenorhabdus sp. XENO-1]|uniref:hypothetical protein n=1 Tax=Xenorhabdus bovienii TaxID=40576 RepID=UPI0020CA7678|nr:hypothetical protein [Xenorhabdus bovienii subsp. africana]
MSLLQSIRQPYVGIIFTILIVLGLGVAYIYYSFYYREPEIALVVGEPYEAMRQRSSAVIGPDIPGHVWHRIPKTDASLRFIDPKYGFITPTARYLAVSFNDGIISSVELSPQTEPLLYNDAIKIVQDLQNQWSKAGWVLTDRSQLLENTPELHEGLRRRNGRFGTNYWRAGDLYQTMLNIRLFRDDKHPDEERYLITLEVARAR